MPRILPLSLALLLAACGTPRLPELDVEQQWSDAMRRLGLFAAYPATEDVRPGDIYLVVPPPTGALPWAGRNIEPLVVPWSRPDHDGGRFSLVRMASLGPLPPPRGTPDIPPERMTAFDHLRAQQQERFRIQPLPREEDTPPAGQTRQPGRPALGRITDTPPPGSEYQIGHADQATIPLRLQRSAIPALTVARLTEGQLSAAGIFGNFAGNLGLSSASEVALTIALRDVQELNMDAWRISALYDAHAYDTFRTRLRPNDLLLWLDVLRGGRTFLYDLTEEACNGNVAKLRDQGVQVAVVTRVVYAGAIEYSFSRRVATALQGALDLQGALARNIRQPPQVPAVVVTNTQGGSSGAGQANGQGGGQGERDATPAGQLRDAVAARLAGLTGITAGENARAGVRTTFGIGTLGGLSLTETFNRPIAVGAGSRLVIPFHHALAGEESEAAGGSGTQLRARFQETVLACRERSRARIDSTFTSWTFRPEQLWRAMSQQDPASMPPLIDGARIAPPVAIGVTAPVQRDRTARPFR